MATVLDPSVWDTFVKTTWDDLMESVGYLTRPLTPCRPDCPGCARILNALGPSFYNRWRNGEFDRSPGVNPQRGTGRPELHLANLAKWTPGEPERPTR